MSKTKSFTRIQVEGYRSLKSVDLRPGRITVMIGPNGAGKSSLISALKLVSLIRAKSLQRHVVESGGASTLLHYGPKVTRKVALRLEFDGFVGARSYHVDLGYAAGDKLYIDEEAVIARGSRVATELSTSGWESTLTARLKSARVSDIHKLPGWLAGLACFHFHDTSTHSALRQNARASDDQRLRADGSNLAAFLHRLQTRDGSDHAVAWTRISMLMERVAPYIKRLEPELLDEANPDSSAVRLRWTDARDHRFDVADLSDGTLRALALFTALLQPASMLPSLLCIDEPELGLHPAAIHLFAELVRSVAPRCQVLIATQSPALLDHFRADEVVVVEQRLGESSLRRLDVDDLKDWLDAYSLSELYDKNVLGGRP